MGFLLRSEFTIFFWGLPSKILGWCIYRFSTFKSASSPMMRIAEVPFSNPGSMCWSAWASETRKELIHARNNTLILLSDVSLLLRQNKTKEGLSGPLDRLNAILSLLQPLDRYRTPSAIGSAIGRPLSRPISYPGTGGSPRPHRSKPLGGLNRAIVAL